MQESPRTIVEKIFFNKISAVLHTVWFVAWFALKLDVGLLTNIVSLEAIYLSIFIGIGTANVHHHVDKLHKKVDKQNNKDNN